MPAPSGISRVEPVKPSPRPRSHWCGRAGCWAGVLLVTLGSACSSGRATPPASSPTPAPTPQPATDGTAPPTAAPAGFSKPYDFTTDWFSPRIPMWSEILRGLAGKPDLRYLEVGVWEGRSLLWALENVFTHPTSRLTGIDVRLLERLDVNIQMSGHADRIEMIIGESQRELKKLPEESFDVIYVDGSHTADDVLADAVLGWQLLKPGGILFLDDYAWRGTSFVERNVAAPSALLPALAIDAFVASHRYEVDVLAKEAQMVLRRKENPCAAAAMKAHCSPLGPYLYDWDTGLLLAPRTATSPAERVEISPEERGLIETILKAGPQSEEAGRLEGLEALENRLGLDL